MEILIKQTNKKCTHIFGGEAPNILPSARPRRRLERNRNIDIRVMDSEDVILIE